jgi:hypothetical protein
MLADARLFINGREVTYVEGMLDYTQRREIEYRVERGVLCGVTEHEMPTEVELEIVCEWPQDAQWLFDRQTLEVTHVLNDNEAMDFSIHIQSKEVDRNRITIQGYMNAPRVSIPNREFLRNEWREYDFNERVYRIDQPTHVVWNDDDHFEIVYDREGVAHKVPRVGFMNCVIRYLPTG